MFLPDIKNMTSTLHTEDRKKLIFKTLIITRDIDRDQTSVEINKHSDQDRSGADKPQRSSCLAFCIKKHS